jgi:BirA family biotin operon repressor/biotin-[acetyl-CoA-carboxylase] ligase
VSEEFVLNPAADVAQMFPFVERLYHFKSIDSTNSFAKKLPLYPAKGLVVICADNQTAGRGQRDNTFFTRENAGLYASIVCPISDVADHFRYNRAISLSIYDAIAHLAPHALLYIKWPNDVYWGDKKVCGILLETVPSHPGVLVLGFGVNANIALKEFPVDIQDCATSLLIETGTHHDPTNLLKDVVEKFWQYRTLHEDVAHRAYVSKLYKIGQQCNVAGKSGIFAGVNVDGRMRLQHGESEMLLMSGPVRFRVPSLHPDSV